MCSEVVLQNEIARGEEKEEKFWYNNIFFLVRHGIEFQQKLNKVLTLTNNDII